MRNRTFNFKSFSSAALAFSFILSATVATAEGAHHHGNLSVSCPQKFVASKAKSFAALLEDAMAVMDEGIQCADMSGVSEYDFIALMIPHHQGAIDMAKGVLLYTNDPEIRNLAQSIITEQQNEIRFMQELLMHHADVSEEGKFPSLLIETYEN